MVPQRVHTVVISCQHDDDVSNEKIRADLHEHVIKQVVPEKYLDAETIYHLNPSGRFVIGGPHGDAGLTGRKIIIDTYGGWGAHGGGAFSGKDPTKVSRLYSSLSPSWRRRLGCRVVFGTEYGSASAEKRGPQYLFSSIAQVLVNHIAYAPSASRVHGSPDS